MGSHPSTVQVPSGMFLLQNRFVALEVGPRTLVSPLSAALHNTAKKLQDEHNKLRTEVRPGCYAFKLIVLFQKKKNTHQRENSTQKRKVVEGREDDDEPTGE